MATVTIGHDWEVERVRGKRRTCAMPASHRRRCRKCGLIEFRSGNMLGADWMAVNRPVKSCGTRET
jgi:hypothetical protein